MTGLSGVKFDREGILHIFDSENAEKCSLLSSGGRSLQSELEHFCDLTRSKLSIIQTSYDDMHAIQMLAANTYASVEVSSKNRERILKNLKMLILDRENDLKQLMMENQEIENAIQSRKNEIRNYIS